jgi:imidazole glycerol-phosphate synthase subunit HisH
MADTIAIVDSGSGNLHSVEKALARAGGRPIVTADPEVVRRAAKVVVPGQGAFADCVRALRARGLDGAIAEVVAAGRPYLGICLGLQILFDDSEEHGPVAGLGLLRGRVRRFTPIGAGGERRKVPHIGWNTLAAPRDRPDAPADPLLAGLGDDAFVYFIHSYYAAPADPAVVALECDYGGRFCAAVRADNLFACQFHPEKSQAVGLRLLENFVRCS